MNDTSIDDNTFMTTFNAIFIDCDLIYFLLFFIVFVGRLYAVLV